MVVILIFFTAKLTKTYGIASMRSIDDVDEERWEHNDGVIVGAEEFMINGNKSVCWLLVHGYISTPAEMRLLGWRIHSEFGDTVMGIRLQGHGELPSKLLGLDARDWYQDVVNAHESSDCGVMNVVGSSLGGNLVLRLAEDKSLGRVYLVNPHMKIKSDGLLSDETKLRLFSWFANYEKKKKAGSFNDPAMEGKHIGYYNMPLDPFMYSLNFISETEKRLGEIEEPVLVQHSRADETTDPASAEMIVEGVSSEDKELVWYRQSNHLLLVDHDRLEVVDAIVEFEKQRR